MPIKPYQEVSAQAAFIARKIAIDAILARLGELSANRFDRMPEAVTWADVGDLSGYLDLLRRVSDQAHQEGELLREIEREIVTP